ncbi:MAG: transglutaminase family protein [Candidatus Diapherotrites archaeon]|uniref:Transglutaminase family protein n=1 Tax=Candidatus Iainarchaeum sp. TaxID=3101447 RepID=A0A938YU95_9ARCH|nr:transglutaminase family protein [Candidatus Diapherotrites archaeon]
MAKTAKAKAVKAIVIALLFLALCSSASAIENSTTIQSVKAEIAITGSGEITGDLQGRTAAFKVISFSETPNQRLLSLDESLEINGKTISAQKEQDQYGNRYAVFNIGETGSFTYRQKALIETNQVLTRLEEYDLSEKIGQHSEYMQPTEKVESNSEEIRTIALNSFDSNSWLETARGVTEWVNGYLTYDLSYYPGIYSAIETLESKRGTCDEFAILAAAMLRAREIPVKFVSGITYGEQQWANHSWIEAFNPESGWKPIDPTYGEAGIVDGTHFYMGAFPDPTDAADEITVPGRANASIGNKQVSVSVQETKAFSGILGIAAEDISFKANQWFEISAIVRNRTNSALIVPVSLTPVEGMLMQKEKQIIILGPLEEMELKWPVRVNAELQPNQFITGKYSIITLNEEIEKNMEVVPGNATSTEADITLNSLVPIVEGQDLALEIELQNLGAKPGNVRVEISNGTSSSETVTVNAFETKQVTIKVENRDLEPYTISFLGPGLSYSTIVMVQEGQAIAAGSENPDLRPGRILDSLNIGGEETILLIVGIAGVIAIVFLLKELLIK